VRDRRLTAVAERFALARPFRIARGTRDAVDLIHVTITQGDAVGCGEGAPSARYGETAANALSDVAAARGAIEAGADQTALLRIMRPGAARNAVDCALWHLESLLRGPTVATRLGAADVPIETAVTIGLDTPAAMGAAAMLAADHPLLKVKLGADAPAACLAAVRGGAPDARLIVDANESWTLALLDAVQPALVAARVELVEQPLPADADAALAEFLSVVPIVADESVHVADDVARLVGRYPVACIKLDKAGGLTAALALMEAARAAGLDVTTGCMVASSLSIAAARHVAVRSRWVDLDESWWLAADRSGGCAMARGQLFPPSAKL
jgi:L-alanine-DL-glutamate epimerase-like enolase superfamily enzyme